VEQNTDCKTTTQGKQNNSMLHLTEDLLTHIRRALLLHHTIIQPKEFSDSIEFGNESNIGGTVILQSKKGQPGCMSSIFHVGIVTQI
jgi:hypothetical protein